MLYLLDIITIFVSILIIAYCLFSGNRKKKGVRFIIPGLLVLVGDSVINSLGLFIDMPTHNLNIYFPWLLMWAMIFNFLFIYELLAQKKISTRAVSFNLLLPLILPIHSFMLAFFGIVNSKEGQSHFIVNHIVTLLIILFYYVFIVLKKRSKENTYNSLNKRMVNALLLQMHIVFIFQLLWILQIIFFNNEFYTPLIVIRKVIIIASTLIFYFYVFELYKHKLKHEKKIRHKNFFSTERFEFLVPESFSKENIRIEKEERYEKSMLDDKKANEYKDIILDFFEQNPQIYLNPQFNLAYLSAETNIPRYYLSQVFNVLLKTSFSTFLNTKRIQYACEKLKKSEDKPQNLNLSQLSEECGYRSRTSFYQNFKEVNGYTPNEYIQLHK